MSTSTSPETEIPDGEILFRYVKPAALPQGQQEIPPGIFNDSSLSCDWKKFQGAPQNSFHVSEGRSAIVAITVNDAIRNPRNPKRAGKVEPEWVQKIYHNPISAEEDPIHGENLAHSLIQGKKKFAVTQAIAEASRLWPTQ